VTRLSLGIVLAALVLYGAIELRPLVSGPSLTITLPENDTSYQSGLVTVSGRAGHASSLTLDGAAVLPDQSGNFETSLALPRGTSILTLAATDRFGRTVRAARTVYVSTVSNPATNE